MERIERLQKIRNALGTFGNSHNRWSELIKPGAVLKIGYPVLESLKESLLNPVTIDFLEKQSNPWGVVLPDNSPYRNYDFYVSPKPGIYTGEGLLALQYLINQHIGLDGLEYYRFDPCKDYTLIESELGIICDREEIGSMTTRRKTVEETEVLMDSKVGVENSEIKRNEKNTYSDTDNIYCSTRVIIYPDEFTARRKYESGRDICRISLEDVSEEFMTKHCNSMLEYLKGAARIRAGK